VAVQAGGVPARPAAARRRALGAVHRPGRAHRPDGQGPGGRRSLAGAGAAAAGGGGKTRPADAGVTATGALVLLYGGTFDPVHNGHLAIARAAHQALGTAVRMMPAADPPHRPPPGATAAQRAAMLELATAGEPGLRVDRRELEREGPSYTVLTLRELRARDPDVPVALLVGADSFLGLPGWREWRALFGMVHFVVADRPGDDWRPDALPDPLAAEV